MVVKVAGEMRNVMRKGDLTAHASLDSISRLPNVVAIGPLEGLKGEITMVDSKAYVSRKKGVTAVTEIEPAAKAAFLVYAQVPKWIEVPVPDFITEKAALEDFVRWTAKEHRFDMSEPFPFLIKGELATTRIHIVNKQDSEPHTAENHESIKVYYEPMNVHAELVGFFSTKHEGVFTHHGSFTHMHLITKDRKLSGHLDDLKLKPGKSVLYLPDLPESQKKQKAIKLHNPKKPYKEPTY